MPICRVCKQEIDKRKDNWIMPSRNYYYHKLCYADLKDVKKEKTQEEYRHLIYDYLSRVLKVPYEYFKIEAQINQFIKSGMTIKGIFFAVKYYYDRNGKDSWQKGYGGIGIVPYIYEESKNYWTQREIEREGALNEIVRQMQELARPKENKVQYKLVKPKKKEIKMDFSNILEGEDDG
jgi:hypothetical protein